MMDIGYLMSIECNLNSKKCYMSTQSDSLEDILNIIGTYLKLSDSGQYISNAICKIHEVNYTNKTKMLVGSLEMSVIYLEKDLEKDIQILEKVLHPILILGGYRYEKSEVKEMSQDILVDVFYNDYKQSEKEEDIDDDYEIIE